MKKEAVTVLCVGDIIIDRERPETIFEHVAEVLPSADITFATCDQAYSDKGFPIRGHGTNSEPRNIPALVYAGFDIVSLANNHTLDYGNEAALDTLVRLREAGIECIGIGKNLAEARQPVILERKGTRVGFLAYSCVHPKGFEAEDNKPGLAPVRVWTIYEQVDEQPATPPRIVSIPYKEDLAAMVKDIKKLKTQVDVVFVSFHWGLHMVPRTIPMYCFDIGHAAIDAGADIVVGSHTHILKGIEMYRGKPIFYSLGNFAAEIGQTQQKSASKDFVKKLMERYGVVPDPECPTYLLPREARATLITKVIIEGGKIVRLSYIPCFVNKEAEPEIVTRSEPRGQEVYNYVADISGSEHLPVQFAWDGDEVLIMPSGE